MVTIRPYAEKDKPLVQNLCLANAGIGEASEEMQRFILNMYCNYYIEQEPENCFVAVDEDDCAVGYIFCSENCDVYEQKFNELYIPNALELGTKFYLDSKLDIITHTMFRTTYPAHLHIDIDAEYQGKGIGSALLDTLQHHLLGKGISSVMLVCGADNEGAIRFYKRNGYVTLITTHLGTAMGKEF